MQRIAEEPRVPKIDGMQFITDADPERHYLDKSVLLRPVYLKAAVEAEDTRKMRILTAYKSLCKPASADEK